MSDLVFYQPDVLPTLTDLCKAEAPDDIDGLSFLPTLLGEGGQQEHEFLYWEYGNQFAVRKGTWKAIKDRKNDKWALYDLSKDISEENDVAAANGGVLKELIAIADREHTPAKPGTFSDRTRHERDRWAKWGTAKDRPAPKPKKPKRTNKIEAKNLIPAASTKLVSASSENKSNDRLAKYAIDGDPATVWHSRWDSGVAQPPHELVIDLGATYQVSGFRYLARQDNGWNGAFAKTEFYLGESADSFGPEPSAGATFSKDKKAQSADCAKPVSARFVKVRVLGEVEGQPFASAAEIGVVGEKL